MKLLEIIVSDENESFRITKARMTTVIQKYELEKLLEFEKNPHRELSNTLIRDTLYGKSTKDVRFYEYVFYFNWRLKSKWSSF